jgi:phospholipase C
MLIVTWDEHGGFFDHAVPPQAIAPGDTAPGSRYNESGFTFTQYGPRVPAIVVSPLVPRNLVDHRLYDHASIPATLESLFGLPPLTARDAVANHVDALVTLSVARTDAPEHLPAPADSGSATPVVASAAMPLAKTVSRPTDSVDGGNLPAILHAAMQQDLALQQQATAARVAAIKTRADAMTYLAEVQSKLALQKSNG